VRAEAGKESALLAKRKEAEEDRKEAEEERREETRIGLMECQRICRRDL